MSVNANSGRVSQRMARKVTQALRSEGARALAKAAASLIGLIAAVAMLFGIWYLITITAIFWFGYYTPWWLHSYTGVAASHIRIFNKPHDCEYDTAPLGNKWCHYEPDLQITLGAVDPDTKRPLVSYDYGPWQWVTLPPGSDPYQWAEQTSQVTVTWKRVEE
jgi:hypothetical protein